jgi:hypothetical protein
MSEKVVMFMAQFNSECMETLTAFGVPRPGGDPER